MTLPNDQVAGVPHVEPRRDTRPEGCPDVGEGAEARREDAGRRLADHGRRRCDGQSLSRDEANGISGRCSHCADAHVRYRRRRKIAGRRDTDGDVADRRLGSGERETLCAAEHDAVAPDGVRTDDARASDGAATQQVHRLDADRRVLDREVRDVDVDRRRPATDHVEGRTAEVLKPQISHRAVRHGERQTREPVSINTDDADVVPGDMNLAGDGGQLLRQCDVLA